MDEKSQGRLKVESYLSCQLGDGRELLESLQTGAMHFTSVSNGVISAFAPQADALIEDLPAEVVLADTAYDSDRLRKAIADKGAVAVIPNNPSRASKYKVDKYLYAHRHLIEC